MQSRKQSLGISVNPEPIETDVKREQPAKAYLFMLVTLLGITSVLNPVHPENAEYPIDLRPLPKEMLLIFEQSLKAYPSISVTVLGITSSVMFFCERNE